MDLAEGHRDKRGLTALLDDPVMGSAVRALDRASQRTRRQLADFGDEVRERRITLGLSQAHVAAACRMSRNHYGKVERGQSRFLTLAEVNRIAAVLGLSPSIRLYPDGPAVRDAGQATRLNGFLSLVRPPIRHRIEVPLPGVADRIDQRAWDAVLYLGEERCAIELEMRLRDVQALVRRVDLKRRDDPTASFLLLVADTRSNRLVLASFAELFADLPRLRPGGVRAALAEGRLPPTGILLI
jgi:transcriptional regulator with XRE-family HTH domain